MLNTEQKKQVPRFEHGSCGKVEAQKSTLHKEGHKDGL